MPNVETKVLLMQIFGEKSHPVRKYQRLMYWFPKFKNLNPYPVPHQLPEDPVDLARFSLKRIAADRDAQITIYQVQLLSGFHYLRKLLLSVCFGQLNPTVS